MAVQQKFYTADDLWELSHQPEYADKRLELVQGVIVEMAATGGEHGGLALEIGALIRNHVKAHSLGYYTGAESAYILWKDPQGVKDTVRAADVAFVRGERLPNGLPRGYIPLAPDLAVEVVSPSDSATDIHEKVQDYLRYGTRLVWFFYPGDRTAVVHTPDASHIIEADGTLDGGDVLPGFSVKLSDVYAVLGK
jgi:Uma2 family endonuclease